MTVSALYGHRAAEMLIMACRDRGIQVTVTTIHYTRRIPVDRRVISTREGSTVVSLSFTVAVKIRTALGRPCCYRGSAAAIIGTKGAAIYRSLPSVGCGEDLTARSELNIDLIITSTSAAQHTVIVAVYTAQAMCIHMSIVRTDNC